MADFPAIFLSRAAPGYGLLHSAEMGVNLCPIMMRHRKIPARQFFHHLCSGDVYTLFGVLFTNVFDVTTQF